MSLATKALKDGAPFAEFGAAYTYFAVMFPVPILSALVATPPADESMLATLFGIVIDFSKKQRRKACFPILVTEFGIVIDCSDMRFSKA